jgi:uncharacterized protein DUF6476
MTVPSDPQHQEPKQIRFLRRLVTTLTVVMIGGLVVVISLLVIRLTDRTPPLPDQITLPDGTRPQAVTMGSDWIGVVSTDDRILIYDRASGKLRQSISLD